MARVREPRNMALHVPKRADDRLRRPFALHLARDEEHPDHRPAPREHVAHVLPRRTGGRRHHGDDPRSGRQRPLALRREEALGCQLRLQLLESDREVPHPARLDRIDVQLQRALRLVHVDAAMRNDAQSRLRLERRPNAIIAEPHALELGALVLEREVGVARA